MIYTLSRRWLFALALLGLIAGLTAAPHLFAEEASLMIEAPWVRGTPKNADVAAGYMRIINKGKDADRLLSVSSTAAGNAQIHEMAIKNGVMEMRPLPPSGLEIKPGASVDLKPGGLHIMFMGLKAPLKEGGKVDVKLTFAKGGVLAVTFDVRAVGAMHMH